MVSVVPLADPNFPTDATEPNIALSKLNGSKSVIDIALPDLDIGLPILNIVLPELADALPDLNIARSNGYLALPDLNAVKASRDLLPTSRRFGSHPTGNAVECLISAMTKALWGPPMWARAASCSTRKRR